MQKWTLDGLYHALAVHPRMVAEDVLIELPAGVSGALAISLAAHGGLRVTIAMGEQHILASVLLAPVAIVGDQDAFNRMVLSAHRMVPLSAFGITAVDGVEHYELFGSLSASSDIDHIVEEVFILAENAIEAAGLVDEWKVAA